MSNGYDVTARMTQVVGHPQRIAPLGEDELNDEARQFAVDLRKAFGIPENGSIPEVMRTMLRHTGLFQAQMDMGLVLAGKGTLPPRERELAILRLAWLLGAPYEWGEHVDIGKSTGVSAEEIKRVITGSSAPGWSPHEAAILRGVEELRNDAMISDATWDTLAKTWSETQLMEFPVLIGQYTSTAYQQNSVRMRLAPTNPGLSHR